ncbi:cupin domain-containing protein [Pollutibacter soli]|uniref:(R)-mandelonitrile lyase n=1 Tax=Pollutibacter soli TaxID=3034157 RepID=UPI0030140F4A
MKVIKNGTQASIVGNENWFTGNVRIDPLFSKQEATKAAGVLVTFEPGARTAWHTHPAGQTLIVISGLGWAQKDGGEVLEIAPGDVIYFEPGEKHWHGATINKAMSHIAIQEEVNGSVVTWMEKVSAEQYLR